MFILFIQALKYKHFFIHKFENDDRNVQEGRGKKERKVEILLLHAKIYYRNI